MRELKVLQWKGLEELQLERTQIHRKYTYAMLVDQVTLL